MNSRSCFFPRELHPLEPEDCKAGGRGPERPSCSRQLRPEERWHVWWWCVHMRLLCWLEPLGELLGFTPSSPDPPGLNPSELALGSYFALAFL